MGNRQFGAIRHYHRYNLTKINDSICLQILNAGACTVAVEGNLAFVLHNHIDAAVTNRQKIRSGMFQITEDISLLR